VSRLYRTMIVLFVAAAVLIPASGIPALKHAHHGWKWVAGGVGWFGGLLAALLLIVLALYALTRNALDRRRTA
jgi:hypothetical protein